jgi:hypothetical protein
LDPSLTSILCSANAFGTPGMSVGFQAKISLLSRRKLVNVSSYFVERWALMVVVLEGSSVPRSICLTSASFGGARMLGLLAGISSSSGFISAATVALLFHWLVVPWPQFRLLKHHSQKHASDLLGEKEHHWVLAS